MIDLFADGADLAQMLALAQHPLVRGFTTNPTLLAQAGVTDYEAFGRAVTRAVPHLPVSFEVLADNFAAMEVEAHAIRQWGDRVFVKVPVTNTAGDASAYLIGRLHRSGIPVNVTAITTLEQLDTVARVLDRETPSYVSVFAGRIADTGVDPVPIMAEAVKQLVRMAPRSRLIWASPREVLNIKQAEAVGCPIITLTPALLAKHALFGTDLTAYSLETVRMFARDARASGLSV